MAGPEHSQELSQHIENALQLLEARESKQLSTMLEELHPVELVNVITAVDRDIQPQLLKHITGLDHLSQLVSRANENLLQTVLEMIDDSRIAAVVRRQDVDDAAYILGSLPRRRQVRILKRLGAERVKELTALLAYDHQTAGRIMNPRVLGFRNTQTVEEALTSLRAKLQSGEIDDETDLFYGYVLDPGDGLKGVFSLRTLLSSPADAMLTDIMEPEVITVTPEEDQERVARLIADYDLTAIPVVADDNRKILGVITVDDVIDVMAEEHAEDLLKLAGTEDQDTVGATLGVAFRSRLPWLAASWCGGIGGALLLGAFETTLHKLVALAFFMPVVCGMGGNVGSQSSTITVCGLASGELAYFRAFRRLRKELVVGLLLGTAFGFLLAVASYVLYGQPRLSVILGLSIMLTMTIAASMGSMLPIAFKRLGIDPVVASGPLVTTATDILSITIYFSVASVFL